MTLILKFCPIQNTLYHWCMTLLPRCITYLVIASVFCIKTHHYIIFFVQPLHSKLGMESYCWPNVSTDQLSWYRHIYGAVFTQVWPSCWWWGILIMVGCALSELKPSEHYIRSCEKEWRAPRALSYTVSTLTVTTSIVLWEHTVQEHMKSRENSVVERCHIFLNIRETFQNQKLFGGIPNYGAGC